MPDYTLMFMMLAVTVLYGAWYEYRRDNRRDAGLLGVVGACGVLGSAAAWVA